MNKFLKVFLIILSLGFFSVGVAQVVGLLRGNAETLIAWDAPTTNADGTALDDLAGFEVGVFAVDADLATAVPLFIYVVSDPTTLHISVKDVLIAGSLEPGEYKYVVRAVDLYENLSDWSNAIDLDVDYLEPNPPENLRKE